MPSYRPGYLVLQYDAEGRVVQRQWVGALEAARELKRKWDVAPLWATYHFEE